MKKKTPSTIKHCKRKKKSVALAGGFSILEGVNQQETSSHDEGSSEATRDITYEFNEYSNLMPQQKKKLTNSF